MKTASGAQGNDAAIGNVNPLRYREYYYDTETGFYYLQSRYYDPAIGRFISADSFATTDCNGFLSSNMFAYCENNPVMRSDPSGDFFNTAIGAVVGGVIGGISAAIAGDNVAAGIAIGAATGAVAGLAVDAAIATGGVAAIAIASIGGAVSSGANYAFTEKANGRSVHIGKLAWNAAVGGVLNTLSFGVSVPKVRTTQGGTLIQRICQNTRSAINQGTTKRVGQSIVQKRNYRRIKASNATGSGLMSSIISGFSWLFSQKAEAWWK